MEKELKDRANDSCELCGSNDSLGTFELDPVQKDIEHSVLTCGTCKELLENDLLANENHWRALNDTMWSEVSAVKVLIWRVLHGIKSTGWSQELIDMMYLTEEEQKWANVYLASFQNEVVHKDCNGIQLLAGDNVVLTKDLDVKGSSITAKRGTSVRGISLDSDNEEYIEGRVDGQKIVILTKYVKKA